MSRTSSRPRLENASRDRALEALRALTTNALRNVLRERAPPYAAFRFERIAIRPAARAALLRDLPMPAPLRKYVLQSGRKRLGDLQGLTYRDVVGQDYTNNQAMRQLHGLLRILGAVELDRGALFSVPARSRTVPLREVPMPRALREALDARGVRTVGQLGSLTSARLGGDFGGSNWAALRTLVARAQSLPDQAMPFARAIDAAMSRLPPLRRKALELRFGAKGAPVVIRSFAGCCGLGDHVDPHRTLDYWTRHLAHDAGPAVTRAHQKLQRYDEAHPSRLSSDEVDALLRVTASRPRYGRDFYLRLLSRLRPRVRFAVAWGKTLARPSPAAIHRRRPSG